MTKKKKTTKKTTKKKAASESRLTPADIDNFKQLLLQKRVEILGDVNSMVNESLKKERSDLSNVPFHMADAGSDNYELENTLGLMDEEVRILTQIDAALGRIENGNYGICLGSGKNIPKARLEAIPWARYCIEYAELVEKGLVKPEQEHNSQDEPEETESETDEEDEEENEEDELEEAMALLDDEDEEKDGDEPDGFQKHP